MNIAVIGTGYVGLVTGSVFADMGNDVICVDKEKRRIEQLSKGVVPFTNPGWRSLSNATSKKGV